MIFYTPHFHKMATAPLNGANFLGRVNFSEMHLIIDGFGGDADMMWDTERLRSFLDEYPSNLGMTKITVPEVLEYHGPNPSDGGISGFVIIAESHISVHTFPIGITSISTSSPASRSTTNKPWPTRNRCSI